MGSPIPVEYQWADATSGECQTSYQTTATQGGLLAPLLVNLMGGFCQDVFRKLAHSSPEELIAIIRENGAVDTRLTYAAEILGQDVQTPAASHALLEILKSHRSPLVREGAVLGLAHHLQRIGIREALLSASQGDPSPGVKRAAEEILDED